MKQVAQVVLPTIKDYRSERDQLFADLAKQEPQSQEYAALRDKIYTLDDDHNHFIDESSGVTAASFNFNDIRRKFEHIPQDLGIDPSSDN